jgi:hypothetical protein
VIESDAFYEALAKVLLTPDRAREGEDNDVCQVVRQTVKEWEESRGNLEIRSDQDLKVA